MRDYELNVLEQYDIEVSGTRKTRGAILCDTNRGLLLLKESKLSKKRVPMLSRLYSHIEESRYGLIDKPLENKEGSILSSLEDGSHYILRHWYSGRECDVRKQHEVLEIVRNLAQLHSKMTISEEIQDFQGIDLKEEYLRHNRELRKTRAFIRKKAPKGDFELEFLRYFDQMYDWANEVVEHLEGTDYEQLNAESIQKGRVVHGEYNYHNVLMTSKGLATTNFDHFYVGIQADDLYYFLRKVMEKHQWNEELGGAMLAEYQKTLPLTKEELNYIAIRLAYPEKFWKSANVYYHSNKAWIPAKSIEKLKIPIAQTKMKQEFLQNIFSFHL